LLVIKECRAELHPPLGPLVPLVDVGGGHPTHSHGDCQLIVFEGSNRSDILDSLLLRLLLRDQLVALHGDCCGTLAAISGFLVEWNTQLELELHGLEGGGGLHGPGPVNLRDLHHGGRGGGSLPQKKADIEGL